MQCFKRSRDVGKFISEKKCGQRLLKKVFLCYRMKPSFPPHFGSEAAQRLLKPYSQRRPFPLKPLQQAISEIISEMRRTLYEILTSEKDTNQGRPNMFGESTLAVQYYP